MSIIFRELNAIEKQILQNDLFYWLDVNNANIFLEKNFFLVAEGKRKEIFLITKAIKELFQQNNKIKPYSVGLGFGEFKRDMLYLSLSGASYITHLTEKKVVISSEGEQPFLYQKHLLTKSVVFCSKKCKVGDKLIITNQLGDFLGIGQLKIDVEKLDNKELANQIAIHNLIDLGWYLRKGK